jgi:hypothetical protein
MALVVRGSQDVRALTPAILHAIRDVDPEQPVYDVRTLEDVVERSTAQRWLNMTLVTTFALTALPRARGTARRRDVARPSARRDAGGRWRRDRLDGGIAAHPHHGEPPVRRQHERSRELRRCRRHTGRRRALCELSGCTARGFSRSSRHASGGMTCRPAYIELSAISSQSL